MNDKKKKAPIDVTDAEEVSIYVAEELAKLLPTEFIQQAILKTIQAYIKDFRVESYHVDQVLREVVLARTKELLTTRFQTQIDEMAEKLAQKAIANGGRF